MSHTDAPEHLAKSDNGERRIQEYYEIAPSIVEKIKREDNSKEVFGDIFNDIRGIVSLIEIGDLKRATAHYNEMALRLKQKYEINLGLEKLAEEGDFCPLT